MAKKKELEVKVTILEAAGDGDRYLIRYKVHPLGLTSVEWISKSGAQQWVKTADRNSETTLAIMKAALQEIEKYEAKLKENRNDGQTNSEG